MRPTLYISLPYGCQQKVCCCTRGTPKSVLRCDQKSLAPQGSVLGDLGWPGGPMCLNCPSSYREQCQGHQPQCDWPLLRWALALAGCGAHPRKRRAGSVAHTTVESLQLDEHQLCIVSKSMLEHEAGNSKKQHEQSKCQRNEKYVQNCDRAFGYFSRKIINRLSQKISNSWEEITKIFKDTIFVFWMLIWHKGVCMRECL